MTPQPIAQLRRTALFAGLTEHSLELILDQSKTIFVDSGDFFFREGDAANSMFQVESGTVSIQRVWEGTSITLGRLAAGDCFGEMSLLDCQVRSASVRAASPCEALEIPAKSLRTLLAKDLEQYAIVMMNLGREVSRRLRKADNRLLQLLANQP